MYSKVNKKTLTSYTFVQYNKIRTKKGGVFMKLKFLVLVLALLLLTACQKPVNAPTPSQPDEPPTVTEPEAPEVPEVPEIEGAEEFEYAITARDWDDVKKMPLEKQAKEFLSALCLLDREVLEIYMVGDTVDELLKIKADAVISNPTDIVVFYDEHPYEAYSVDVTMSVRESESDLLPIGIYNYTLRLGEASSIPVEYFGPTERYEIFNGSEIPKKESEPVLYNTYVFIQNFYRNNEEKLGNEAINPETQFENVLHLAVHALMEMEDDYIFETTLSEFKEYMRLRFGYTDEAVLNRFANALSKKVYATDKGNGVYAVCCAHGYGSLMYDLMKLERNDTQYSFYFDIFADSAHTVKCAETVFTFEENKDSDVMTLIDIQYKTINDLSPVILTP